MFNRLGSVCSKPILQRSLGARNFHEELSSTIAFFRIKVVVISFTSRRNVISITLDKSVNTPSQKECQCCTPNCRRPYVSEGWTFQATLMHNELRYKPNSKYVDKDANQGYPPYTTIKIIFEKLLYRKTLFHKFNFAFAGESWV